MNRLFKDHLKRDEYILDGMWSFITDPDGVGEREKWYDSFPENAQKMYVPSCFNMSFGLLNYRGKAWYQTELETSSSNIVLEFEAVLGFSTVWLDGKLIGKHYGGYTAFSFEVTNLEPGKHTLTVMADNTSNDETIPSAIADWYRYGGIIRSVNVYELKNTFLSDMKISYALSEDYSSADITVSARAKSFSGNAEEKNVSLYFNGEKVFSRLYDVSPDGTAVKIKFRYTGIKLWDIFKGNLYTVCLETEDDDIIDRIGFRKIEIKNKKIYLNGKPIFIKGVNRHEDYPDFGNVFPKPLMQRDIDIIKNLGCNAIRGSHYPNSKYFLDMLDEAGILFWSEIPMWGSQEDALKSPLLIERGLEMHSEMINQYYNHPAIVIWGMHNEIDTRTKAAYILTKKFSEFIRSLDSSRLVTYATMYIEDDICLEFADFISINKYFGWYGGDITEWHGFLENVREKMKKSGAEDKAVVMSEFGGAALYGHHTFDNIRWTEEYQAELLSEEIKIFHDTDYITGTYVWQYADARTSALGTDRVRGFNNKGIVNEYRKPKLAYNAIKKVYQNIE